MSAGRRPHRRRLLAGVGACAALVAGAVTAEFRASGASGLSGRPATTTVMASRAPSSPTAPSPAATPVGGRLPTLSSHPVRLGDLQAAAGRFPAQVRISALGVSAPVASTGTNVSTGELELPNDTTTVAWWSGGASLGDRSGTVTLAAHVDHDGRPGVFFRLAQLSAGDRIEVTGSDGAARGYRVESVRQVRKTGLGRLGVFTAVGLPRLILITCGGDFDASRRAYEDNVVVVALPA